jgi:hypothetical protein
MTQTDHEKGEVSDSTRNVADSIAMGLVSGRTVDDVAGELVKQGWKQADAVEFVQKIDDLRKQAVSNQQQRAGFRRGLLIHLLMGVIWIAIGIAAFIAATPDRDYSAIGVAVITLGVLEAGWSSMQLGKKR